MVPNNSIFDYKNVLFILAHNDDEAFVTPVIELLLARNCSIHIIYTTHGSSYGASSAVRRQESLNVFARLGLDAIQVHSIGETLGVFDGESPKHFARLVTAIETQFSKANFDCIVAPAWEGGHIDHDAAHLLALSIANQSSTQPTLFEFSLYNCYKMPRPFFRVMHLIPQYEVASQVTPIRFSLSKGLLYLRFCGLYASQRRTFLALLPGILKVFLLKRRVLLRQVGPRNYQVPPHLGELFYTRRFRRDFLEVKALAPAKKGT